MHVCPVANAAPSPRTTWCATMPGSCTALAVEYQTGGQVGPCGGLVCAEHGCQSSHRHVPPERAAVLAAAGWPAPAGGEQ